MPRRWPDNSQGNGKGALTEMANNRQPPDLNIGLLALHAATAAMFFFVLQYWGFENSLNLSIVWAVAGALGAAYLSWSQQSRNGGN